MFTITAAARHRLVLVPRYATSSSITYSRSYVSRAPSGLSEGEANIHKKLTDKFSPKELAVQDVSGTSKRPISVLSRS